MVALAARRHLAHLAGTQPQGRVLAFACDQLHGGAGAARQLGTLARLHLDAVHHGEPIGMLRSGRQLPGLIAASRPLMTLITGAQAFRCDDVTALAVLVQDQGDVGGAVRIVLDALDAGPRMPSLSRLKSITR